MPGERSLPLTCVPLSFSPCQASACAVVLNGVFAHSSPCAGPVCAGTVAAWCGGIAGGRSCRPVSTAGSRMPRCVCTVRDALPGDGLAWLGKSRVARLALHKGRTMRVPRQAAIIFKHLPPRSPSSWAAASYKYRRDYAQVCAPCSDLGSGSSSSNNAAAAAPLMTPPLSQVKLQLKLSVPVTPGRPARWSIAAGDSSGCSRCHWRMRGVEAFCPTCQPAAHRSARAGLWLQNA